MLLLFDLQAFLAGGIYSFLITKLMLYLLQKITNTNKTLLIYNCSTEMDILKLSQGFVNRFYFARAHVETCCN